MHNRDILCAPPQALGLASAHAEGEAQVGDGRGRRRVAAHRKPGDATRVADLHLIGNGDGTLSLVACNNLYVASNDGNAPLVADRTATPRPQQ